METEKRQFDVHQVYQRVSSGYLPYIGSANFPNGNRKCNCQGDMERIPINQQFVQHPEGKLLVDVHPNDGRLTVSNANPDFHWECRSCPIIIPVVKEQKKGML